VLGTCPYISFTVSFLAQFMQNPGRVHWEAVKRVFHYLIGMKDTCFVTGGTGKELEAFSDTDWASQEHCHPISGYCHDLFYSTNHTSECNPLHPNISPLDPEFDRIAEGFASKITPLHTMMTIIFPKYLRTMIAHVRQSHHM
jgi:hypothetical protein